VRLDAGVEGDDGRALLVDREDDAGERADLAAVDAGRQLAGRLLLLAGLLARLLAAPGALVALAPLGLAALGAALAALALLRRLALRAVDGGRLRALRLRRGHPHLGIRGGHTAAAAERERRKRQRERCDPS